MCKADKSRFEDGNVSQRIKEAEVKNEQPSNKVQINNKTQTPPCVCVCVLWLSHTRVKVG